MSLILNQKSLNEGPLGYIVDNTYLKKIVFKEVLKSNFIKFMGGVNIKDIKSTTGSATIFSNKGNFNAPLIVGADGRNSKIRFFANIKSFFYDYNQVAFVFNISHTRYLTNPKLLKDFSPQGLWRYFQCKIIIKSPLQLYGQ